MMRHLEPPAVKSQTCVIFTMNVDHLITALSIGHHADVRRSNKHVRVLCMYDCSYNAMQVMAFINANINPLMAAFSNYIYPSDFYEINIKSILANVIKN